MLIRVKLLYRHSAIPFHIQETPQVPMCDLERKGKAKHFIGLCHPSAWATLQVYA